MKTLALITVVSFTACTRPAPQAPASPSRGVVIMSMHDVEPYERVAPSTPKPPPEIEYAAPLYGALAGAVTGVMLNTGLTLLTEHRWPNNRKYDRDRANTALVYGAGLGLAAGTFALANSISERLKWRERRRLEQQTQQPTERR